MKRPLRIAFCRINQETNALSPVPTTMDDFRRTHLLEGARLLEVTHPSRHECEGLFKNVELSGFVRGVRAQARKGDVELVPLFSAWAAPSGPLSRACFDGLCERLERALLDAGPVDALYLCLHGAMGAEHDDDPEARFIELARRVVGDEVPIGATFDLHGNMTREKMAGLDLALAYKTNPHRDHARLGAQMGRLLVRAARREIRPTMTWRSLPMVLGGGTTLDFLSPMRSVFSAMRRMEKDERVLGASVFMCHPFNAHQELGWSAVVVTDASAALADELADELAERCWSARVHLPPRFHSAAEAIDIARKATWRRKLGTVTVADVSDVVTAGATGENTKLLAELLDKGRGLVSYVPLRDAVVVDELWREPAGARVKVRLGGKLDPARNPALDVEGVIASKTETHGLDRVVVLDVGSARVVVSEGPAVCMRPSFYTSVGLDPWRADIVVVKNFFPFRLFFLPLSRKTLYVTTGGITDPDCALDLSFAGPVHPRDYVRDWREADARRRAPLDEERRRAA